MPHVTHSPAAGIQTHSEHWAGDDSARCLPQPHAANLLPRTVQCTVSSILSFLEKLAVSVQSWASVNFLKSRQATTQQGIEASLTGYNVQETFSTRSQN